MCHLPELWQALNLLLHLHSDRFPPRLPKHVLIQLLLARLSQLKDLTATPRYRIRQCACIPSGRRQIHLPGFCLCPEDPTATVNVPRRIVCKRNLCCQIHSLMTRLSLSKWGFHMLHFAMYQGIVSFLLNCDSPPKRTAVWICCIYCLFFFLPQLLFSAKEGLPF